MGSDDIQIKCHLTPFISVWFAPADGPQDLKIFLIHFRIFGYDCRQFILAR
jgi:hypothetical protein